MINNPFSKSPFLEPIGDGRFGRRRFVTGAAAGAAMLGLNPSPAQGQQTNSPAQQSELSGTRFNLDIGYQPVNFTGRDRIATSINDSLPAPILRWREGDRVSLTVKNNLAEDSSIHWHGMILPYEMDGVPGMSFDGIKPGESFHYEFDLNQNGTYWYHSHSGFQEQTGLYGAIVIEPKDADPVSYDRDHVIMLSDWTDQDPQNIYAKLKKQSHYYNFQERTLGDLWSDIRDKGVSQTWDERAMWNQMRMSQTDLADVTGYTYTYLMNGVTPDQGWMGMFQAGEKVRLRFINAAAMTIFDVRIPGLKMTVVAADGQNVEPISVDEFRIGVAETYDVIVEPSADSAYTLFAQGIDRSGYCWGTLTPDTNWRAEIPEMDSAALLGHQEMGMAMDMGPGMDHSGHDMSSAPAPAPAPAMDHSMHAMSSLMPMMTNTLGMAGMGSTAEIQHAPSENGPHTDMQAEVLQSGLEDPGIGLRNNGRRVLNYADIRNLTPTLDMREPTREIQLHLTGNMSRYMWSLDGLNFTDAEPLLLTFGERLRVTLVNDTMMTHPMHLHGMWSELETGEPNYIPRKHTVLVQPGSSISYLVTADAMGSWAYHCHLMFHMAGMMREVRVIDGGMS
jgi:CopA family copper-resistance protein